MSLHRYERSADTHVVLTEQPGFSQSPASHFTAGGAQAWRKRPGEAFSTRRMAHLWSTDATMRPGTATGPIGLSQKSSFGEKFRWGHVVSGTSYCLLCQQASAFWIESCPSTGSRHAWSRPRLIGRHSAQGPK
jgi:hypothetical protein